MPQKKRKKKALVQIALFAAMFVMQIALVSAANATYDQILQPVQAIYDLIKYSVTIIAGLVMLFAGITYITSGSDPGNREQAKNLVMYVLIGLAVIWAAPLVVKLVMGG